MSFRNDSRACIWLIQSQLRRGPLQDLPIQVAKLAMRAAKLAGLTLLSTQFGSAKVATLA